MKRIVYLRAPVPSDAPRFCAAARASRALHSPWVRPPATESAFLAYVERMADPTNRGFLVFHAGSDTLAGSIEITQIVRGVFRSGYLGYYAFTGFERRGLMSAAVRLVVRQAFRELRLHRLEANIQPGNDASIALVRACGFRLEGYSPRYLKIRGRWRDHERWAIVAP